MQCVETASCNRRRGKRMPIHNRTTFGNVISKSTWRNQMSRQTMNCKAIRRTREASCCVVILQVGYKCGSCPSHICQGGFIGNRSRSCCILANSKQPRCKDGVDQTRDASTLKSMLFKNRVGDSKTQ